MNFRTQLLSAKLKLIIRPLMMIMWAIALCPFYAGGQSTSDVDPSLKEVNQILAPVRMDGIILYYVRGVSAYPAETRATTIEKRICKAAKNFVSSVDSVRMIPVRDRMQVYVGNEFIMNVYDVDGEHEGIEKELFAEIIVFKINEGIKRYWEERSPSYVKINLLKSMTALGLMLVTIVVFIWLFKRLKEFIRRRIQNRIQNLENISFKLIQANQLLRLLHTFARLVKVFLIIVIIIACIEYILALFPWTRGTAKYALNLMLEPIRQVGNGFIRYLPSLIFLIIIFLVTEYTLKLIKVFFTGIASGGIVIQKFYPDWAMPTYKIVRFLVIIFALVIAFPYIPGSDSHAFQGISVFLGILFSLGSSSFIANIIAGYSMTFRRAFKIGDRIRVNEFIGYVVGQSLMVTRLRSVKNEEIVIPNSVMLSSSVFNYSLGAEQRGIILHTTVKIGYGTPWRKVESMLKRAADRTEGLLKDPPPYVLQQELGDFGVTYEINGFCKDVNRMFPIYTALHQNILDLFNENNVQIMVPAYEGDPDTPKVVPKEEWDTPLADEKTALDK